MELPAGGNDPQDPVERLLAEDERRRTQRDADRRREAKFEASVAQYAEHAIGRVDGADRLKGADPDAYASLRATLEYDARCRLGREERSDVGGNLPLDSVEQFQVERDESLVEIARLEILRTAYLAEDDDTINDPQPATDRHLPEVRDQYGHTSLVDLRERLCGLRTDCKALRSHRLAMDAVTPPPPGLGATRRPVVGSAVRVGASPETSVAGRPGRPPGDGAFRSEDDARTKLGMAVQALIVKEKATTQRNVIWWLEENGYASSDVLTTRIIRYWVNDVLGYPDWRAFADSHQ